MCSTGTPRILEVAILPLLLFLFLLTTQGRATTITDARWSGRDLVVTFSDSVACQIDLAATDTSELVIRVAPASSRRSDSPDAAGPPSLPASEIPGPQGMRAILTSTSGNRLRITVTATGRLGYSMLWRPFTHRLVIHTFDWSTLQYAETQYHQGLLALEGGLAEQAEELLAIASATGERRASSALGVYYAVAGRDSLARRFLTTPADADDYAALELVQRRQGDTAAAAASRRRFEQDRALPNAGSLTAADSMTNRADTATDGVAMRSEARDRQSTRVWQMVAIGFVGVLVIGGLIYLFTKGGRKKPVADRSAPPAGFRHIEAERPAESAIPVVAATKTQTESTVDVPPPAEPIPATPPESVAPAPAEPSPTVQGPTTSGSPFMPPRHPGAIVSGGSMLDDSPVTAADILSRSPGAARPAGSAESNPPAPPALFTRATDPADQPASSSPASQFDSPATVPGVKSAHRLTGQAAERQEKLRSGRTGMQDAGESVVSEARRLSLSRDNVELRRRMDAARGPAPPANR